MADKLRIPYPVIVEGKYDKIRLANVMEGQIITTDGFGVFKKQEKQQLIRRMAAASPLILLTDSDGGGKVIRSHLTGMVPKDRLIQLYIPQIKGKERRKAAPSAAGTLGVEGMEDGLLRDLLRPYAVDVVGDTVTRGLNNPLSKADLYTDGLTGRPDSSAKRDELCQRIGLPSGMTSGALLEALRMLYTYEEYLALVGRETE
ncbi:MAG: DUF4093 domain-containing protein [Clostridia bacterium]|nr:DUF4093 domain-containing protein [Clostridia bacterium]